MTRDVSTPPATTQGGSIHTVYHRITRPIVMIGFGSIGRGTLPLLERHFAFNKDQLHVITPEPDRFAELKSKGYSNLNELALTKENYVEVLTGIFGAPSRGEGPGDGVDGSFRGIVINVSVDTSTIDIMRLCRTIGVFYLDTVIEPWKGFYFDDTMSLAERSNYALREQILSYKRQQRSGPGSITSITCCGANPGMVSFLLKEALMKLAKDLDHPAARGDGSAAPTTREEWALLMRELGVKGVHIAERDTQVAKVPKKPNVFCCTWSAEGFLSEGNQPAELGWGTHEKWFPPMAHRHESGCKAAIYLAKPGANTRVRSWCPTLGSQYGFLVTHNESVSIADYYTVGDGHAPEYRPTVHYAYQPCPDAVLSLHEAFGHDCTIQSQLKVYNEEEIATGFDELGVLVYGHAKNALWLGSTLTFEETRRLAPDQNATGLQVTSAIVAGLVWALENPSMGVTEADELDYKRCIEVQRPYLGKLWSVYTDWTPLSGVLKSTTNQCLFPPPARTDVTDPWQFANVLVD
jgi:homospermidine synthase